MIDASSRTSFSISDEHVGRSGSRSIGRLEPSRNTGSYGVSVPTRNMPNWKRCKRVYARSTPSRNSMRRLPKSSTGRASTPRAVAPSQERSSGSFASGGVSRPSTQRARLTGGRMAVIPYAGPLPPSVSFRGQSSTGCIVASSRGSRSPRDFHGRFHSRTIRLQRSVDESHEQDDHRGGHRDTFSDPVVAGAIIDRLLHRATVINIKGKSYRMRAYHEQERQEGGAIVR